jgi:hypothetical protein
MMSDKMKASRPQGRSRRPKIYDEGRVCVSKACETVLSRYNRAEFCFVHNPVKYPRLRGVLTQN